MHEKNFDQWNFVKKTIDSKQYASVKRGEVYWCHLGINIGVEQNGSHDDFQRPVIIIKKYSHQLVLVAPLTTRKHSGDWYLDVEYFGIKQQVILNQIKPVDTKRFSNSLGEVDSSEVNKIMDAYIKLLS